MLKSSGTLGLLKIRINNYYRKAYTIYKIYATRECWNLIYQSVRWCLLVEILIKLTLILLIMPRRLWQTINKLVHRNSSLPLPTCTSASALADSLASFFTDKISKLSLPLTIVLHHHLRIHLLPRKHFSTFKPASESEISKIWFLHPKNSIMPISLFIFLIDS